MMSADQWQDIARKPAHRGSARRRRRPAGRGSSGRRANLRLLRRLATMPAGWSGPGPPWQEPLRCPPN
eukprot:140316-Alexandrium_andersonii.AAC.1